MRWAGVSIMVVLVVGGGWMAVMAVDCIGGGVGGVGLGVQRGPQAPWPIGPFSPFRCFAASFIRLFASVGAARQRPYLWPTPPQFQQRWPSPALPFKPLLGHAKDNSCPQPQKGVK